MRIVGSWSHAAIAPRPQARPRRATRSRVVGRPHRRPPRRLRPLACKLDGSRLGVCAKTSTRLHNSSRVTSAGQLRRRTRASSVRRARRSPEPPAGAVRAREAWVNGWIHRAHASVPAAYYTFTTAVPRRGKPEACGRTSGDSAPALNASRGTWSVMQVAEPPFERSSAYYLLIF